MGKDTGDPSGKSAGFTRREFMYAGGAGALGLYLAGRGGSLLRSAPNGKVVDAAGLRALGVDLPPGAAPLSDQFLVGYYNSIGQTFKALDFYETVYSKAPLGDNFNIPLVRLTSDYKLVPGAATSWGQTSPTTWEFHITPGIMWSDGNELTANDYVETIRYSAPIPI